MEKLLLKPNADHRRTHSFLHYFAPAALLLLLAVLLLSANVQKGECLSSAPPAAEGGCNGTSRIADCLPDDGEEELLMESETSRRILAANRPKTIAPLSQQGKRPYCDANVYGNCISRPNQIYDKRSCPYNTCGRAPK